MVGSRTRCDETDLQCPGSLHRQYCAALAIVGATSVALFAISNRHGPCEPSALTAATGGALRAQAVRQGLGLAKKRIGERLWDAY
jgi:hypothetical protein